MGEHPSLMRKSLKKKQIPTSLCLGPCVSEPKVEKSQIEKKQNPHYGGTSFSDEKKSQKKTNPNLPVHGAVRTWAKGWKILNWKKTKIPLWANIHLLSKKGQKKNIPTSLCMERSVYRSNVQKSEIEKNPPYHYGQTSVFDGKNQTNQKFQLTYRMVNMETLLTDSYNVRKICVMRKRPKKVSSDANFFLIIVFYMSSDGLNFPLFMHH